MVNGEWFVYILYMVQVVNVEHFLTVNIPTNIPCFILQKQWCIKLLLLM